MTPVANKSIGELPPSDTSVPQDHWCLISKQVCNRLVYLMLLIKNRSLRAKSFTTASVQWKDQITVVDFNNAHVYLQKENSENYIERILAIRN